MPKKVIAFDKAACPWQRRRTAKKPKAQRMRKTPAEPACAPTDGDEPDNARRPLLKGMGGAGVVKRKNIFRGFQGR